MSRFSAACDSAAAELAAATNACLAKQDDNALMGLWRTYGDAQERLERIVNDPTVRRPERWQYEFDRMRLDDAIEANRVFVAALPRRAWTNGGYGYGYGYGCGCGCA